MFRSSSSPLSLSSQLPSNVPLLHRTARIRPADARDARSLRAPSLAQRSTPSSSPSPSLSSTTPTPSPSSSASSTPSPPAVQSATKPKLPSHSTGFSPLSKSTSPSSSSKLKPRAKIQPGLGGFKTTPPSTSFRPNSTSSPEPHPTQFARLARYNADLAQLGLPPTTRSSPPPEQTSSAPAKGKFEDPFLKSALRFNGPLVKGSRPRAQHRLGPSSSEREELKDFLSEKGRELLQRDQRKVHHRWAWEWFKEGKDLVDIGRQLARLAADPRDQDRPLSPAIVSSWILKHLSRPRRVITPTSPPSPHESEVDPLDPRPKKDPAHEPVCPPSPTNAHSYHLLTPALWSRLTDPHQPQFYGKTFAETLGKQLEDRAKESQSVWDELWARGWRGEGMLTGEGDVGARKAEMSKQRGAFDEAGASSNPDLGVDFGVLKKLLLEGSGRDGTVRKEEYEPETMRIRKLLLTKEAREMVREGGKGKKKGKVEAKEDDGLVNGSTEETWRDVVMTRKRKDAMR